MVKRLQTLLLYLFANQGKPITGNRQIETIEALRDDYLNQDSQLKQLISLTNLDTEMYPNTSGGLYNTLTVTNYGNAVTLSTLTVSKGFYVPGKVYVYKNGQRLYLGADYSEFNPASGVILISYPTFSNDSFMVDYVSGSSAPAVPSNLPAASPAIPPNSPIPPIQPPYFSP